MITVRVFDDNADDHGLSRAHPQLRERPLLVERDVRIDRHRDLNVGVTDDLPDHVRRNAKLEQESHTRASKVMKAYLAETGPLANLAPAPADIVGLHLSPASRREHEPVVVPVRPRFGPLGELPLLMLAENRRAERGERVRSESSVVG